MGTEAGGSGTKPRGGEADDWRLSLNLALHQNDVSLAAEIHEAVLKTNNGFYFGTFSKAELSN